MLHGLAGIPRVSVVFVGLRVFAFTAILVQCRLILPCIVKFVFTLQLVRSVVKYAIPACTNYNSAGGGLMASTARSVMLMNDNLSCIKAPQVPFRVKNCRKHRVS